MSFELKNSSKGIFKKNRIIFPLIIGLIILNISKIIKAYKFYKDEGLKGFDAIQKALETIMPTPVAKLAVMEPKLYYSLYLSFKDKKQTGPNIFKSRLDNYGFLIKSLIFISIIETIAVQFVLPRFWQIVHLILIIWGMLMIYAIYRSMIVYQHCLKAKSIYFQIGLSCHRDIPIEDINSVNTCSKDVPVFSLSPCIPKEEPGFLYMAVGEKCNIVIDLKQSYDFHGFIKDFKGVNKIYLSLEKPNDFIERIRPYLGLQVPSC